VDAVRLPNPTWENRSSCAVHLHVGAAVSRPAVLFISGVHAGELGGPDSAIYFLYRLIDAYRNNTAIKLGDYTFSARGVQSLMNGLDLYVLPCVNPDGRTFVFQSLEWWRKNRNPNVGMASVGVDINRNYDFLWSSGVGSSLFPQDDIYRGPAPFSEPETRNVDWLMEQTGVDYFMDIHGPSGVFVYNWGDADDQSSDPSMNFRNPAWDGRRVRPYAEYISTADYSFVQQLSARVVGAANSVAGGMYRSQQSFDDLYPTTATSDDYAFSRHLVNSTAGKAYGFTFEYGGGEFFPSYPQMLVTIDETNAAMLEFAAAAIPGAAGSVT
jgi:carboxypeptidase T